MPKKKSLIEKTQEELTEAVAQQDESIRQFEYWSIRRTDASQRVERLQAALDALEGKTPQTVKSYSFENSPSYIAKSPPPQTPNIVTINGTEMVLEPGFKVGKNSFGEDAIVPDDMPVAPMSEPFVPANKIDFSLPSVGDDFTDPKDLF